MADSNTILPAELQHLALKQPEKKADSDSGLDQDAFLELMLTQIQHQDPLNPMESGDFLSQMAQFGTVNGITELNGSFATLSSSLQSSQALQASTMVGNTVLVPGNSSDLISGGQISGAVDLNNSTSNLVLNIADITGQTVRQVELGSHAGGMTKFTWDGLDNSGNPVPSGKYTIEAAGLIGGEAVAQPVLVNAKVDSVSLSKTGGEALLNLNGLGTVSISEVREIM
jgi:flagellar basal-body rod modification protein FlgD